MTSSEREAFLQKQRQVCREGKMPFFMPSSGYCGCGRDIVEGEMEYGNDGRTLVTGCPYCHRSYCD